MHDIQYTTWLITGVSLPVCYFRYVLFYDYETQGLVEENFDRSLSNIHKAITVACGLCDLTLLILQWPQAIETRMKVLQRPGTQMEGLDRPSAYPQKWAVRWVAHSVLQVRLGTLSSYLRALYFFFLHSSDLSSLNDDDAHFPTGSLPVYHPNILYCQHSV